MDCSYEPPIKKVFLYTGEGTGPVSPAGIKKKLERFAGREVEVETGNADDLKEKLKEHGAWHTVIFPGGSCVKQGQALGEEGVELVQKFVAHGGNYIGDCAGANFAGFSWIFHSDVGPLRSENFPKSPLLQLIPGSVEGPAHHGLGGRWEAAKKVKLSVASSSNSRKLSVIMCGGGVLPEPLPNNGQVLARFAHPDIVRKVSRIGESFVQKINNQPAVVVYKFGEGTVGLLTPHLEVDCAAMKGQLNPDEDWDPVIADAEAVDDLFKEFLVKLDLRVEPEASTP